MMIKPIETTWHGHRFRSRTEARWGMALKLSGVPFDYEPNGFDLPSGWYLPDFWLPAAKSWLEIKGVEPDEREMRLARELSDASGSPVLFGVGSPVDAQTVTGVCAGEVYETGWQTIFGSANPKLADALRRAQAERFDGKSAPGPAASKRLSWW